MGDLVLEVIVEEAAFAELRHHFLAFQLNQDKKVRTEVVAPTKRATFSENRFTFTVPNGLRQDVVVEDVLYLALFGIALKAEAGHLARFVGAGSLSLHEIREELLQGGMCEAEVMLSRLLRREGTSVPVAIVKLQVRAIGNTKPAPVLALTNKGGAGEEPVEPIIPELRVHVFGAYGLCNQDCAGNVATSPFVELRMVHDSEAKLGLKGLLVGKTREAAGGGSVVEWNQSFIIDVNEGLQGISLRIQVMDERGDEDVVLATRTLRLYPMPPHDCSPLMVDLLQPPPMWATSNNVAVLEKEEGGGNGSQQQVVGTLLIAIEYLPDGPMPSSMLYLTNQNLDLPPDMGDMPLPSMALVSLQPRSVAKELGQQLLVEEEVVVPFSSAPRGEEAWWGGASSAQQDEEGGGRPKLLGPGKLSRTGGRTLWEGPMVMHAVEDLIEALEVEDREDSPVLVMQWLGPARRGEMVRMATGEREGGLLFQVMGYALMELRKEVVKKVVSTEAMAVVRLMMTVGGGDGGGEGGKKKTLDVVFGARMRVTPVAACRRRRKRRRRDQQGGEGEVTGQSAWEDIDLSNDHDDIDNSMSMADPSISAVEKRLLALTDELAKKDAMIEQLGVELEQRAEAIRNCGTEILRGRKLKEEVEKDLQDARDRLEEVEREVERASTLIVCEDGNKLQRSSLTDLQRVLPVLVKRYHAVRIEKEKLLLAFQALSKEAKRLPGLKAEVSKLEKALLAQGAFIQTLQSRQAKVDSYKTTIKMQEKVIHRLENLLEAKLTRVATRDDGRTPREDDPTPRGVTRGAAIEALKDEVRELRGENERLKQAARTAHDVAFAAKASRIQALEEELVGQAKASAKEIAALKMRIFELEHGLGRDGLLGKIADQPHQEEGSVPLPAASADEDLQATPSARGASSEDYLPPTPSA